MTASTDRLFEHFRRIRTFYESSPIRGAVAATVTGQRPDGIDVTWADSDIRFVEAVLRNAQAK